MVEKVAESIYWEIKHTTLYLDDLDALIDIFESAGSKVEIVIGNYRVDGRDELAEVPLQVTHSCSITTYSPHVSLELTGHGGRIYAAASGGAAGRGLAHDVRAHLDRIRSRWRSIFRSGPWDVLVAFFATASIWTAAAALLAGELFVATAAAAVAVASSAYAVWTWRESLSRNSRIILRRRADVPGFWERNRDQLVLVVVSGAVGSAITAAITAITD